MIMLDILSRDVAATFWVTSSICVPGMSDTELHDI